MKKLLAILLVVTMLFCLVPCVYAEGEDAALGAAAPAAASAPADGAAADGTAEEAQPGFLQRYGSILLLVVMLLVFYFIIIRPQKKQEKEYKAKLDSLQPGDEITTKGGIIGKVVSIKEETMVIETSKDRTKIRLLRSALASIDVKAEDAQD